MFFFCVQLCLDPWTVLRQADLQRYLFFGGKGMFLCFHVKKIVPVDTLLGSSYRQNWNIPWDIKTYLWNVFLPLSSSVYEKGFLDRCCLCNIWIQREWIWIGWEQIWERKRKKYLLAMTRIYSQCCNISESFIFVRENILKLDLIYLLRRDQTCYVYGFIRVGSQSCLMSFSEIEIFLRITLVRWEFSWDSMKPSLMRSVSWDLAITSSYVACVRFLIAK